MSMSTVGLTSSEYRSFTAVDGRAPMSMSTVGPTSSEYRSFTAVDGRAPMSMSTVGPTSPFTSAAPGGSPAAGRKPRPHNRTVRCMEDLPQ